MGTGAAAPEQLLEKAVEVTTVAIAVREAFTATRGKVPVWPLLLLAGLGELVGILPLVAKLVILLPFFRVGKDLVSRVYLLEPGLGGLVTGVNIGVVPAGQATVSLLYLLLTGASLDA